MDLSGKVVLVTGGSTGIGAAIAESFIKKRAKVIVFGLNKPDYSCDFYKVDVSKEEQIVSALKSIDKIDVLVNNAGVAYPALVEDTTNEVLNKTWDINVKGVFWMCKRAIPKISEGGAIINISSIAGLSHFEELSVYNMSKASVISLTRALVKELKVRKIRANCIAPGMIDTPIHTKMFGEKRAKEMVSDFSESIPLKRYGKPEEIAHACIFLAENDFVNGATLVMDGGETA